MKSGLSVLDAIFSDPRPFEPARAEGVLTVAMSDAMALELGPRLTARFDREAPQLCMQIQRLDQSNLFGLLAEGQLDLGIGYATLLRGSLAEARRHYERAVPLLARARSPVLHATARVGLARTLNALQAFGAAAGDDDVKRPAP